MNASVASNKEGTVIHSLRMSDLQYYRGLMMLAPARIALAKLCSIGSFVRLSAPRVACAAALAALAALCTHAPPAQAQASQSEVFYCANQSAPAGGTYAQCGGNWTCGVPTTGNELTLINDSTNTLVQWSQIASTDTVPICGLVNGAPSTSASVTWMSKASFLAGSSAVAQTTATKVPSAPPMICIGKMCTSASTSSTTSTTSTQLKWNPGHYLASLGVADGGTTSTTWPMTDEISTLGSSPGVVGYRAFVYWGTVEGPNQGQYNFALLDDLMNKLAAMSPQRHLVLVVLPGAFSGGSLAGRTDILPAYILNGSQYGPSPVSGSYGWWGGSINSAAPVAALHRQAVAQAYGKMLAAIAARYDSNPLFEGIMVQETSWVYGGLYYQPGPGDFSESAFVSGFQTALSLAVASAPHTNIALQNTWLGDATATQNFETWMYNNRVLPAETDTRSASYIQKNGIMSLSWGLNAYMGLTASGSTWSGPDMRPMTHAWCDVESTELGYPVSSYTGQSVIDIINGINQYYECSHAFWTYMPNGTTLSPSWAWWPNVLTVLQANPLTNTSYPKADP